VHAFDFILVLFSFVYAAAVTHVLSTAGEIIHRLQAHPAIVVQCKLDVSLAVVHLRVVDRPVGFACGKVLWGGSGSVLDS
jgi:hypothetical protein